MNNVMGRGDIVINLTKEDLEYALKHTKPSALRQLTVQVPNTKWSDIGGQAELKQLLIEAVEWSLLVNPSFLLSIKATV